MLQKKFSIDCEFFSLKGLEGKVAFLLKDLNRAPGFLTLPQRLLSDLKLVLREAMSNAVRHGKASRQRPAKVLLRADSKKIEIRVQDWGAGFRMNSLLREIPDETLSQGRGLWIIKNLVDQMQYRKGRPNQLIMVRRLHRLKNLDSALELFDVLQSALQEMKELSHIYELFMDFIVDAFNVQRASLLIWDGASEELRVVSSRGIAPRIAERTAVKSGEGIAGVVFRTGRPLLVNNASRLKRQEISQARRVGYATQSFVSVPVIALPSRVGEKNLGVLNLTERRDGSPFTEEELKWLNLMASQAASAFRMRALMESIREHEGVHRELEIVREIQGRLLPQKYPVFSGWKLWGDCRLATRGGGDYFDILKVDGSLRGIMADVSGHHVGSAITMASFRSVYRSLVFDPNTSGQLLQALRWALHEELLRLQQFISCWVFELEPHGHLNLAGAGHPPVLIYRANTGEWEEIFSQHLPLGLEDETRLQNTRVEINKGDWVFFYTDGLFDPRMRATGYDRFSFQQWVQECHRKKPEALVTRVFEDMSLHYQALSNPDDVALLALKKV